MGDTGYQRWICEACGFVYDEAKGDPDSGLAPGTRYADIPADWECPLCGMRKSDLRLLRDTPAPARSVTRSPSRRAPVTCRGGDDHVVIIGAGIAGWSVAEQLRLRMPERDILLITACSGDYYTKPALSTALTNGLGPEDLVVESAASKAAGLGIAVRTRTRVIDVDRAKRRIATSKGSITYGKLVLALGGQQRDLAIQGDAADQIIKINDLRTYRRLRQRLDEGATRVSILGGGLIGCEFAEDLSSVGVHVDIIEPARQPLANLLVEGLSQGLRVRLAEKGVRWHLGKTLDRLEQGGDCVRATLSCGQTLETDVIISAAGLQPHTTLAKKIGLQVTQGVCTDHDMRTADPDIFAVGDCAAVDGRIYHHVDAIRLQAKAVAGAIAGTAAPFDMTAPLVRVKTPSFPLAVCLPAGSDCAEHPSADGLRVDYLRDGELVGFMLADEHAAKAASLYGRITERRWPDAS